MSASSTPSIPSSTTPPCCGPSCCTPAAADSTSVDRDEAVRELVREGYGKIAEAGAWSAAQPAAAAGCGAGANGSGGGCCGPSNFSAAELARAVGYAQSELTGVAEEANLGLSCGNPIAIASLRSGETVLDLGSGAGFDAFIAGPRVAPAGRVIGVDMTPQMISKARAHMAGYTRQTGLANVEFRLGEIERLPVSDSSIDVVISNCVLNLSPDKERVWSEIARVLKPGGRVAISDLVLLRPLPAALRADIEALVGCIAGATLIPLVENMASKAGLKSVRVVRKSGYVDAMNSFQDPLYQKIAAGLGPGETIGSYVTSANITAVKP
jgi:arsenite methyltransferase